MGNDFDPHTEPGGRAVARTPAWVFSVASVCVLGVSQWLLTQSGGPNIVVFSVLLGVACGLAMRGLRALRGRGGWIAIVAALASFGYVIAVVLTVE